jgi:hypothetical protein
MLAEISGALGAPAPLQVAGRRTHNEATWREATRDQAAISKPSNANRDVITLLHEIDNAVVQNQLDGYIRICRHVASDCRRQMETAERYGCVRPEPTAWLGLEFANRLFSFGKLGKKLRAAIIVDAARFSETELASRPVQQSCAEMRLQILNVLADHGA